MRAEIKRAVDIVHDIEAPAGRAVREAVLFMHDGARALGPAVPGGYGLIPRVEEGGLATARRNRIAGRALVYRPSRITLPQLAVGAEEPAALQMRPALRAEHGIARGLAVAAVLAQHDLTYLLLRRQVNSHLFTHHSPPFARRAFMPS